MHVKSINKIIFVWLFIILPLVGIFLFRKSFDLGLYGDDWQHLYILWHDFYVTHSKSFFDIKSYLNPYFPESFYLGIIEHFWGYYAPAYFIASFLCRLFANIALYFLSYELTKSKLAAFIASLIFLFSAAGLQTTDWVFNMNTYVGLGLLAVASTVYLKIRKLKTFKSWLYPIFIITFILGLGVVPTRMHGAAPFIVLMDLFLTFIVAHQRIKFDKYLVIRIFLAIGIFAMLVHFKSFGEESYTSGRFNDSYKLVQALEQNGYHSWWLYFLATIGHLVLPDNINFSSSAIFLQNFIPVKNPLHVLLIIEAFFSTLILFICSYIIIRSKKIFYYLPPIIFNIIWFIFLFLMGKMDTKTGGDIYFAISLGGQFIFWALWFYIIAKNKSPFLASTLIVTVFWITSLTILYWLFTPYYIIETTGRYMTMGTAGISIFLGALSTFLIKNAATYSASKDTNTRFLGSMLWGIPILILFIFLVNNLQTSQNYFSIMHQTRNRELTQKTWTTLLKEVPVLDKEAPSVFYFTTDNPSSLYGVLTFGFYMRAGLEYRNPIIELTPLPCTDYNELLAYVKDGSPLQKVHARKAAPVPLSRIFAFDFRNGELINITDSIRTKISQDLTLNQ